MNICLCDNIFTTLSEVITSEKVEAYVIGGYVRDCLLKREHSDKDIDIVVLGSGIEIAKKAARKITGINRIGNQPAKLFGFLRMLHYPISMLE